ncbi:MAG: glycosyltransferase family 9 protein [Thermodesulfobacteriota bacterium]|nr:glycosyltransferase family 9 protein [Thermodesulfobacteriota bacterium]
MIVKGDNKLANNIQTVLVIQIGDIGDVVLSLPVLRAIKENLPGVSVIYAVRAKAASLAEACQWADNVVAIDTTKRNVAGAIKYQMDFFNNLRSHRIDLAIDLRMDPRGAVLALLSGARQRIGFFAENGRLWRNRMFTHLWNPRPIPGQHMIEYLVRLPGAFGLKAADLAPRIQPSDQHKQQATALLEETGISEASPLLAIQPFSLWRYKEWGGDKYIDLIRHFTAKDKIQVIVLGSPEEAARAGLIVEQTAQRRVHSLAGKTSIGLLPAILERCDLSIGGDSAGLHIAAAVGTPTIAIFGPSAPHVWAPTGKRHRIIDKGLSCIPCNLKGCEGMGTSRCLEELSVGEVIAEVETALKKVK